ncbi:helix-turn-helix transcriptional regulator [Rhodococcus sp. HNM0563]|uniref:winged helix-turn-helix transcriptional regulator n=1 Tax=unclassified Rhodococcus (in: high G+C Gram-positive bacteria) TaxID=192944 RepID=UPI00146EF243|nr:MULTISPECIES: helix-turn-helix domain-containing protein [unclassified Rhodococcus (in: high G+C Gram-positive bacteria)]MCK0093794.1 helix-turn-helix transcriptional regulator [Rhodococcus sp. F64268]NLU64516.1 helix-turn-helix transcriptional regulator [Rhodococcus sp. HNM0563]
MHRKAVETALRVCPVEVAVAVLGGAWKLTIVKYLLDGPRRFGELGRLVGPVSPRVLTRQLRDLETDGIVSRTVFAEVPPRVEYELTDLGRTLDIAVAWLDEWGKNFEQQLPSS